MVPSTTAGPKSWEATNLVPRQIKALSTPVFVLSIAQESHAANGTRAASDSRASRVSCGKFPDGQLPQRRPPSLAMKTRALPRSKTPVARRIRRMAKRATVPATAIRASTWKCGAPAFTLRPQHQRLFRSQPRRRRQSSDLQPLPPFFRFRDVLVF